MEREERQHEEGLQKEPMRHSTEEFSRGSLGMENTAADPDFLPDTEHMLREQQSPGCHAVSGRARIQNSPDFWLFPLCQVLLWLSTQVSA